MAHRHNEQSVYGRNQTDYMWTGYRVQSRCRVCGVPLRVRQTPRKLRKGSILQSLLASMVSHLLLQGLMLVERWFGTCNRPAYQEDSSNWGGEKATVSTRLLRGLVAALVIGKITSVVISRKRRNTGKGSSTNVVSRAGQIFLAIPRYRSKNRRASQGSSSTSLATRLGVGGD